MVGQLSDFLWNPWLLGLFLVTGCVCTLRSGFFQVRGARLWWRCTLGGLLGGGGRGRTGGISQVQALCTALASTIGTGSIAGVAAALWLGGPGAIFWMWVSALLGTMTGCFEKLLSVHYRRAVPGGWRGGPMYYLRDGVGSPLLASWFAVACIPATLAGGNLVQSSSIATALHAAFGADRLVVGAVTAGLTALVMFGGLGRIARFSSALVPLMAVLYLGGGALVLLARWQQIPAALALIVQSALAPQAAVAGGLGYTAMAALRYGVARGVFTNEAGLGTSAMAHAAADVDHPARQGMWGLVEVCLSTLVVCTVTALVLLVSGVYSPSAALRMQLSGAPSPAGADLTAAAFASVLGATGGAIVAVSLTLFAFSSILGWSYYGQQAVEFLSGGRGLGLYRVVFLLCVVVGSLVEGGLVWQLVDLCNALMALPNLAAILLLAPQAAACLAQFRNREAGAAWSRRGQ